MHRLIYKTGNMCPCCHLFSNSAIHCHAHIPFGFNILS